MQMQCGLMMAPENRFRLLLLEGKKRLWDPLVVPEFWTGLGCAGQIDRLVTMHNCIEMTTGYGVLL